MIAPVDGALEGRIDPEHFRHLGRDFRRTAGLSQNGILLPRVFPQRPLHHLPHPAFLHVRHCREIHIFFPEHFPIIIRNHLPVRLAQIFRLAQDRHGQRSPLEDYLLEVVVNLLGGRVPIGIDLLQHHAPFLVYFLLREYTSEGYVHQQVHCAAQILLEDSGVDDRLLLGGVCVEFPSEFLDVGIDSAGAPGLSALEQQVLGKMGKSSPPGILISGAGPDVQGAVGYRGEAALEGKSHYFSLFSPAALTGLKSGVISFDIRFRSAFRKPGPFLAESLWRFQ